MSQPSSNQRNRTARLLDHLDDLENAGNWSRKTGRCDACMRHTDRGICDTPVDRICVICAEHVYRCFADQQEIAAWHRSRFFQALSANGQFRWRMTVLHRYMEAVRIVEKQNNSNMDEMHRLLAANLGWGTDHPLGGSVRQWAFDRCMQIGRVILPVLLEPRNDGDPWQLYANIAMCAISISPADIDAQRLFEAAARHSNPLVREKIAEFINSSATPLTGALRRKLRRNADSKTEGSFSEDQSPDGAVAPKAPLLEPVLTNIYTIDKLQGIYELYLRHMLPQGDFRVSGKFNAAKLKKRQLVSALARVFSNNELLDKLLSLLPSGVIEALTRLTWMRGEHPDASFPESLDPPLLIEINEKRNGKFTTVQELDPHYAIIPVRKSYAYYSPLKPYRECIFNLYLPDPLRNILKQRLSAPEEYNLTGLETIEKTDYVYDAEERILAQIGSVCACMEYGKLRFARNGCGILKTSAKKMAASCGIVEFFDGKQKGSECLCTQLMVQFLRSRSVRDACGGSECLRQIFDDFFTRINPEDKFRLHAILPHINSLHALWHYYGRNVLEKEMIVRASLRDMLRTLTPGLWYPVDSLIDYCRCREFELDLLDRSFVESYLSRYARNICVRSRFSYDIDSVFSELYPKVIVLPVLKGFMFLMAAFGLLKIAYNEPGSPDLENDDADCPTEFGGLRYFSPTLLGAYILGLTNDYVYREKAESGRLTIDEKRLLIHLDGKDRIKAMILEQLADQIGENGYRVTWDSFLKSCDTRKDIQDKILLFRKQVSNKPPKIWEEFLKEVENRIDPLILQPHLSVFRLKERPELIELMARDEVLKKYILKAEDYHILIHAENLPHVKKRLKTLGYFTDQFR